MLEPTRDEIEKMQAALSKLEKKSNGEQPKVTKIQEHLPVETKQPFESKEDYLVYVLMVAFRLLVPKGSAICVDYIEEDETAVFIKHCEDNNVTIIVANDFVDKCEPGDIVELANAPV